MASLSGTVFEELDPMPLPTAFGVGLSPGDIFLDRAWRFTYILAFVIFLDLRTDVISMRAR